MSQENNFGFGTDARGALAFHLWLKEQSGGGQRIVTWSANGEDIARFRELAKWEERGQILRERAALAAESVLEERPAHRPL